MFAATTTTKSLYFQCENRLLSLKLTKERKLSRPTHRGREANQPTNVKSIPSIGPYTMFGAVLQRLVQWHESSMKVFRMYPQIPHNKARATARLDGKRIRVCFSLLLTGWERNGDSFFFFCFYSSDHLQVIKSFLRLFWQRQMSYNCLAQQQREETLAARSTPVFHVQYNNDFNFFLIKF